MRGVPTQGSQCRLEVALGVDQEIAVDHDLFPVGQALHHLDVAIATCTEFDLARFERPTAAFDQHDATCAGIQHGGFRDRDGGHGVAGLDLDGAVEVRLQQPGLVRQFNADARRARLGLDGRVHERHLAVEVAPRVRRQRHHRCLAGPNQRQVLLEHVGHDPHARQVRNLEECLARHEAHAGAGRQLDHHAVRR